MVPRRFADLELPERLFTVTLPSHKESANGRLWYPASQGDPESVEHQRERAERDADSEPHPSSQNVQ